MPRLGMRRLTEKAFLAQITWYARLRGWLVYHTFDSRRSAPGFPDLVLLRAHPDGVGEALIAEVKTDTGRLTPEQAAWLSSFRACGIAASVWRPADWEVIKNALD